MPQRQRAQRKNPLIPVDDQPSEPAEVTPVAEAPICGACFPAGWPEGGDYASCVHGEWSTTEGLVKRAAAELNGAPATWSAPNGKPTWIGGTAGAIIDGVTTDGVPVTIELREGQPALVSLVEPSAEETVADLLRHARAQYKATGETPILDMRPPSPFAPAPHSVIADATDLDTGEDVMFMPSGG